MSSNSRSTKQNSTSLPWLKYGWKTTNIFWNMLTCLVSKSPIKTEVRKEVVVQVYIKKTYNMQNENWRNYLIWLELSTNVAPKMIRKSVRLKNGRSFVFFQERVRQLYNSDRRYQYWHVQTSTRHVSTLLSCN